MFHDGRKVSTVDPIDNYIGHNSYKLLKEQTTKDTNLFHEISRLLTEKGMVTGQHAATLDWKNDWIKGKTFFNSKYDVKMLQNEFSTEDILIKATSEMQRRKPVPITHLLTTTTRSDDATQANTVPWDRSVSDRSSVEEETHEAAFCEHNDSATDADNTIVVASDVAEITLNANRSGEDARRLEKTTKNLEFISKQSNYYSELDGLMSQLAIQASQAFHNTSVAVGNELEKLKALRNFVDSTMGKPSNQDKCTRTSILVYVEAQDKIRAKGHYVMKEPESSALIWNALLFREYIYSSAVPDHYIEEANSFLRKRVASLSSKNYAAFSLKLFYEELLRFESLTVSIICGRDIASLKVIIPDAMHDSPLATFVEQQYVNMVCSRK